MGTGGYNINTRNIRAEQSGYYSRSIYETTSSSLKRELDPNFIDIREARDNIDHPETIPIIIGIDVTGSMGDIPQELIRDGLPHIIDIITKAGINDASICICAFGDATDYAPLQISQFEACDELLDKWLTSIWLESCGGGNGGEDPSLLWWFASKHIKTDAWDKRGQKGIIITISDELCHKNITITPHSPQYLKNLKNNYSALLYLENAKRTWNICHIHTHNKQTQEGVDILGNWKELIGEENVIREDNVSDIPKRIAEFIISNVKLKEKTDNSIEDIEENFKPKYR